MFKLIRQSVLSTLCLAVLLCAAYPMLVTGAADAFFPKEAAGDRRFRPHRAAVLQREVFPSPPLSSRVQCRFLLRFQLWPHQQGSGRARPGLGTGAARRAARRRVARGYADRFGKRP